MTKKQRNSLICPIPKMIPTMSPFDWTPIFHTRKQIFFLIFGHFDHLKGPYLHGYLGRSTLIVEILLRPLRSFELYFHKCWHLAFLITSIFVTCNTCFSILSTLVFFANFFVKLINITKSEKISFKRFWLIILSLKRLPNKSQIFRNYARILLWAIQRGGFSRATQRGVR